MQPTMHRPNWDGPNDQTYDRTYDESSRMGLGAIVALIAIIAIAVLALTVGGDTASDTSETPGDPAIAETDPTIPAQPLPTTIAP